MLTGALVIPCGTAGTEFCKVERIALAGRIPNFSVSVAVPLRNIQI